MNTSFVSASLASPPTRSEESRTNQTNLLWSEGADCRYSQRGLCNSKKASQTALRVGHLRRGEWGKQERKMQTELLREANQNEAEREGKERKIAEEWRWSWT